MRHSTQRSTDKRLLHHGRCRGNTAPWTPRRPKSTWDRRVKAAQQKGPRTENVNVGAWRPHATLPPASFHEVT